MTNKKAMYNLGYGLYVLSARCDGKDNACIINTAIQVTTTPNRVIIAVNKANYTHRMIVETGEFTVSMLDETAPFALFQHFGFRSGRDVEKFDGTYSASRSKNSILHLTQHVNAYITCKVVTATDLGTHTLFLADVTDGDVLGKEPSMTYAYYQQNVKPRPAAAPAAPTGEKKTAWRCTVCGYIYEGETLPEDYVCPICKHGAADFEKV